MVVKVLYVSSVVMNGKFLSHLEIGPLDLMYFFNYCTLEHFHSKWYSLVILASYESVTVEMPILY
jgi:hypothetical protein